MAEETQLIDAAENKFLDGARQMANTRLQMILSEAARVCGQGHVKWDERTVALFLQRDKAQVVLPTNQGNFVITIDKG